MKKFLAVFDGFRMSESNLRYAIQVTRSEQAHLVGVFLDDPIYTSYRIYTVVTTNRNYEEKLQQLDAKDQKKRDASVLTFQKACESSKISFSIHRDKNIAIQELKHESMFADLVIINEYETFTRSKEQLPTHFIRELLADVQCPVIVTPAAFNEISRIVLLYDGKPYSLHAIKMFSYVADGMKHLPVEVLTVKDPKLAGFHLPDNKLMREFIKRHFTQATYTVLKGDPELEIIKFLRSFSDQALVVSGAYQRSDLSRWFNKSMADALMKESENPLFIAHAK